MKRYIISKIRKILGITNDYIALHDMVESRTDILNAAINNLQKEIDLVKEDLAEEKLLIQNNGEMVLHLYKQYLPMLENYMEDTEIVLVALENEVNKNKKLIKDLNTRTNDILGEVLNG